MPKRRDPVDVATDLGLSLDEVHGGHLSLAEDHRALHPARAGSDHEHALVCVGCPVEALRVPATPVLLACGGVLRADERWATDLPAGDALVAADALADVVELALLDLHREERVRDGGPGGADNVELARVDDGDHRVRTHDPPDTNHRLVRVISWLDPPRVRLLVILLEKPG